MTEIDRILVFSHGEIEPFGKEILTRISSGKTVVLRADTPKAVLRAVNGITWASELLKKKNLRLSFVPKIAFPEAHDQSGKCRIDFHLEKNPLMKNG